MKLNSPFWDKIYRDIASNFTRYKIFQYYIIFFIALFSIYLLITTNNIVNHMAEQTNIMSRIYSRFVSASSRANTEELVMDIIYEEVVEKLNFPVILTDSEKRPTSWANINLPLPNKLIEYSELERRNIMERINSTRDKLGEHLKPIEIKDDNDSILGYLYYGPTDEERKLKKLPYIASLGFILFIISLLVSAKIIKRNQEKFIWIGLAKETAHQLGTPISALSGWIEILREEYPDGDYIYMEMNNDIERLKKITYRFSKIGSLPEYKEEDLVLIIDNITNYFKRRLPSLNKEVNISFEVLKHVGPIPVNKILFEWAIENLIKNSIDAIKQKNGKIKITLDGSGEKYIKIKVRDDGKGMSNEEKSRIFMPGFTTKKRGWGLGMTLVKRIVEEYHNGHIDIIFTEIGKGTTIQILLPINKPTDFHSGYHIIK